LAISIGDFETGYSLSYLMVFSYSCMVCSVRFLSVLPSQQLVM